MKWRIFFVFVLGFIMLATLTLVLRSYCPAQRNCKIFSAFGRIGVAQKVRVGNGAIGKWKITLADKGELYYLFSPNRTIVQTDKKTYEATHIAPARPANTGAYSVDIEKAIDALSAYLKELKQPSSLSAMDQLEKGM